MTSTEPTTMTQVTVGGTSDDQSTQSLDPSALPFLPVASSVGPSTARTSFTQVDHGDDQQPILPSSHDQGLPLDPIPTSQDGASTHNITLQAPELISTLSQDQQQSVQRPPTPSTQPQVTSEVVPQTPQTYLTFLLISGRRRTMSFEPELAIGRVKELAWNSWPTGLCLSRPS